MTQADPPPALDVDAVTKEYGEQVALAAVGLTVPAGEAVALVGRNGSGKSTLLRIAAGLLEATGGTLLTPGVNLWLGGLNRLALNYEIWNPLNGDGAHSFKAMFQMAF